MNVFRVSGGVTEPAIMLDHLNPQTQEFSLDERGHPIAWRTR
jgi:hypothetical protein